MHGPKDPVTLAIELIDLGDNEAVGSLIDRHPELIDQRTYYAGGTLLHYAAANSDAAMVAKLIEKGFSVNAKGKHYGDTPLHAACCESMLETATVLLDHGADVHADSSFTSPLFGAVLEDSVPLVALLAQRGADLGVRYTLESGQNVNAEEFARLKKMDSAAVFLKEHREGRSAAV